MLEYYVEFHFDYVNKVSGANEEIILPLILVVDKKSLENLITIIENSIRKNEHYQFKFHKDLIIYNKSLDIETWESNVRGRFNTLTQHVYRVSNITFHFPSNLRNTALNKLVGINGIGIINENEVNILGSNSKWIQKHFLIFVKKENQSNEFINIDIR